MASGKRLISNPSRLPCICTLSSTSLLENKQKPENAGIKIKKQNKNDKNILSLP